jgi:hypothetical protein
MRDLDKVQAIRKDLKKLLKISMCDPVKKSDLRVPRSEKEESIAS